MLIDCVEGGASVSFMLPISRATAESFWRGVAASAARARANRAGRREASGTIIGTVQILFSRSPRISRIARDVAKMLVQRRARRHGVGAALLAAAESAPRGAGKTLLVLDTASGDAERLYAKLGWQRCGVIPGYALLPQGGLCDTTIFYRALTAGPGG